MDLGRISKKTETESMRKDRKEYQEKFSEITTNTTKMIQLLWIQNIEIQTTLELNLTAVY